MNRVFYILLGVMFFSCGKNTPKSQRTAEVKAVSLIPSLDEIQRDLTIEKATLETLQLDSIIFHDSIIRGLASIANNEWQNVYIINQPKFNLNKMLKNGKSFRVNNFNDQPKRIEYWQDSTVLQLYFSEKFYTSDFAYMDTYFLYGYKKTTHCDYLFYESAGICVGWYYGCFSLDKQGNILHNIILTGNAEYDGNFYTTVLEKQNDSTYIQIDQNGDDYTNPKKGKFWQYDITRTEIIFHANGNIDTRYLSSDSIPKPAKKL